MKRIRVQAGLTQSEMASLMGLGKTAYVDLESDDPDWKKFKHRHLLALERVSLKLAVEHRDLNLALPSVRRDALDLAALIRGDKKRLKLEIQEWYPNGSAFLTIIDGPAVPKMGDRLTVTVDHPTARRERGSVVTGLVDRIFERVDGATIILKGTTLADPRTARDADDIAQEGLDEAVATELGIDPDELSDCDYELYEDASGDGFVFGNIVTFTGDVPESLEGRVFGDVGARWIKIGPLG